jgi:hypothetical protein
LMLGSGPAAAPVDGVVSPVEEPAPALQGEPNSV